MSAWFTPPKVDEYVSGAIAFNFDEDGQEVSTGKVTAWCTARSSSATTGTTNWKASSPDGRACLARDEPVAP